MTDCFPPDDRSYTTAVSVCTTSNVPGALPQQTIGFLDNYFSYATDVSIGSNEVEELEFSVLDCPSDGSYFKTTPPSIMNSEKATTVSISPNPAQNFLNITLDGSAESVQVVLTDLTGREVSVIYDGAGSGLNGPVSLPLVQAGLYFVTIRADGKTLASAKLIIQ